MPKVRSVVVTCTPVSDERLAKLAKEFRRIVRGSPGSGAGRLSEAFTLLEETIGAAACNDRAEFDDLILRITGVGVHVQEEHLNVYRGTFPGVTHWVVAASSEDAERLGRDQGIGPCTWFSLDDTDPLTLYDDESNVNTYKTCGEWATWRGRGFLGSEEHS